MWAFGVAFSAGFIAVGGVETITGYIFCDNQFEFYFNGELIKTDPLDFTPHQAVKVSFEYDGTSAKTYAIMCQDYASASGYEYTSTNSPKLGDGNLLAEFSDGTVTSTAWKVYTVTFGPTDASIDSGCSSSNLDVCATQDNGMPTDWYTKSFDDSSWISATQYTTSETGWGRAPSYSGGMCQTITSPDTGSNADPSSLATTEDECLNPRTVMCGGDETCSGSEGQPIWGADLERDNKMIFRLTVAAETTSSPLPSPSPTPAPTSSTAATPAPTTAATPAPTAATPAPTNATTPAPTAATTAAGVASGVLGLQSSSIVSAVLLFVFWTCM